jgi:GNAT superfamily N-acetyltransferase
MTKPSLRPAQPADLPAIVRLIGELAAFENLTHQLRVTEETLYPHLFGDRPVAEALVAEVAHQVVGFALFFTSFSTFLAKPGLYLEDLYVVPAQRSRGIGAMLLAALARLTLERDYARLEWSVLDWNTHAIRFYQRMGATMHAEWNVCRVTDDALRQLSARA